MLVSDGVSVVVVFFSVWVMLVRVGWLSSFSMVFRLWVMWCRVGVFVCVMVVLFCVRLLVKCLM